jgi:Fur family transcriptional regulator, ferric uptake regulator
LTFYYFRVILLTENHFQLGIVMSYSRKTIETALRQHGYKITPQRRTVIDEILRAHEHQTPAAIYEQVKGENRGIGLVTIYRTLEILEECGLICETHSGHSCRSYLMSKTSAHHHHLICSDCGKVVDFADCGLTELENRLKKKSGFKISGHLLEFLGQCRQCAVADNKLAGKRE